MQPGLAEKLSEAKWFVRWMDVILTVALHVRWVSTVRAQSVRMVRRAGLRGFIRSELPTSVQPHLAGRTPCPLTQFKSSPMTCAPMWGV